MIREYILSNGVASKCPIKAKCGNILLDHCPYQSYIYSKGSKELVVCLYYRVHKPIQLTLNFEF